MVLALLFGACNCCDDCGCDGGAEGADSGANGFVRPAGSTTISVEKSFNCLKMVFENIVPSSLTACSDSRVCTIPWSIFFVPDVAIGVEMRSGVAEAGDNPYHAIPATTSAEITRINLFWRSVCILFQPVRS